MRISDLSRESGVSIPTIKFYLREGLLPPGRSVARTQARYDDLHLRRLRLIRALVEVGGLSLAAARRVLASIDRRGGTLHDVLADAHSALAVHGPDDDGRRAAARAETDRWLATTGWTLAPDSPARDDLADAFAALTQLGWEVTPEVFDRYRRAADEIAASEIEYVAGMPDRAASVEATVVGTVVFERALAALRRLAQEHHSRRRFGAPDP